MTVFVSFYFLYFVTKGECCKWFIENNSIHPRLFYMKKSIHKKIGRRLLFSTIQILSSGPIYMNRCIKYIAHQLECFFLRNTQPLSLLFLESSPPNFLSSLFYLWAIFLTDSVLIHHKKPFSSNWLGISTNSIVSI